MFFETRASPTSLERQQDENLVLSIWQGLESGRQQSGVNLPLVFEPNRGQATAATFFARSQGYLLEVAGARTRVRPLAGASRHADRLEAPTLLL